MFLIIKQDGRDVSRSAGESFSDKILILNCLVFWKGKDYSISEGRIYEEARRREAGIYIWFLEWALKWWQKSIYKVMNINEHQVHQFILLHHAESWDTSLLQTHRTKQKFLDFIRTNFVWRSTKTRNKESSERIHKICHACINRTPPRNISKIKIGWLRYWHGNSIKIHQDDFVSKINTRQLKLCLLIQFSIWRALPRYIESNFLSV